MKIFRRHFLAVPAAVIAIAAVGSGGYALAGSMIQPNGSPDVETSAVETVPEAIASKVAEFTEPKATEQVVKTDLAGLDEQFTKSNGMNFDLAAKVESADDTYLVPGSNVTCVASSDSAHCTPNEYIGKDFEVNAACESSHLAFSVSGVVVDGFTSAVVNRNDGSSVKAEVANNFLRAEFSAQSVNDDLPHSLTLSGAGVASVEVPLKTMTAREMRCA